MTRRERKALEEIVGLIEFHRACKGDPYTAWVDGFAVRSPRHLGRSIEGRLLAELYSLSTHVRSRKPFDLSKLDARPGQSLRDWFAQGIAAFEDWIGLPEHGVDETEESVGHDEEVRR